MASIEEEVGLHFTNDWHIVGTERSQSSVVLSSAQVQTLPPKSALLTQDLFRISGKAQTKTDQSLDVSTLMSVDFAAFHLCSEKAVRLECASLAMTQN